jgi:oxygen-independent coproporphyrinogen-3 oxidase
MNMSVHFDPELMRRYDREGPRYTSYPTAMQFRDLPADCYAAAAASSAGARDGSPLSLYVHIPFCQSPCFYCGCNKIVTRQIQLADPYLARLFTEISLRSAYFDSNREVEQLHLGGGTPTFLSTDRLQSLVDMFDRFFRLSNAPTRDYSIEIDPRTVDETYVKTLAELGFNRISIGVQDFDPAVQQAINRVQPVELVRRILDAARANGFGSINFDLIYGLPLQTLSGFGATLERVITMRPERLAVYGYAHMPKVFKAQRQLVQSQLPNASTRLALLQLAVGKLTAAGYEYIGMDHFALPTDGLAKAQRAGSLHRSFQGYTTHASRDLVSFGVSAIGQIGGLYIQNHKSMRDYEDAIDGGALPSLRGVTMTDDDVLRKDVIQQIMCHGTVDIGSTEARHGIDFEAYFHAELARIAGLQADGLVLRGVGRIDLTPRGRLLMRNVAMAFDRYRPWEQGAAEQGQTPMSRAI